MYFGLWFLSVSQISAFSSLSLLFLVPIRKTNRLLVYSFIKTNCLCNFTELSGWFHGKQRRVRFEKSKATKITNKFTAQAPPCCLITLHACCWCCKHTEILLFFVLHQCVMKHGSALLHKTECFKLVERFSTPWIQGFFRKNSRKHVCVFSTCLNVMILL